MSLNDDYNAFKNDEVAINAVLFHKEKETKPELSEKILKPEVISLWIVIRSPHVSEYLEW